MEGRIRVGVVGLGVWGQNHALAYSDYYRCDLAVVCDLDEDRARVLGERHDCEWTTSVEELASSDVEAVSIATPDFAHFKPVDTLLRGGKHVLVEKPLATTVADGKAMVSTVAAAGTKFMVDFHARWHLLFMGAKAYVEKGELGDPVMAYARLSDTIYVPTEMLGWGGSSGPEWFLFPHTMDVVRWLIEHRFLGRSQARQEAASGRMPTLARTVRNDGRLHNRRDPRGRDLHLRPILRLGAADPLAARLPADTPDVAQRCSAACP